jgi:hypothetical protein
VIEESSGAGEWVLSGASIFEPPIERGRGLKNLLQQVTA